MMAEEKKKDVKKLFMAHVEGDNSANSFLVHSTNEKSVNAVWIIDSDCSIHMIGVKELFENFNESRILSVRLGDDKEIPVLG